MTDNKFVLSATTILDISRALDVGMLSSEKLLQLYASRIEAHDKWGRGSMPWSISICQQREAWTKEASRLHLAV